MKTNTNREPITRLKLITGVVAGVFYASTAAALDVTASTNAVKQTVSTNPMCTGLSPFYWEIGTKATGPGLPAHGTGGTRAGYKEAPDPYAVPSADRTLNIASAGKLVFGAYVVQRKAGILTSNDMQYLQLSSGYPGNVLDPNTAFKSYTFTGCGIFQSVGSCFTSQGNNSYKDSNLVGKFNYGGGHFQAYSALSTTSGGLGLGGNYDASLAKEINTGLSIGSDFNYINPGLAGGAQSTVTNYTQFLKLILTGNILVMKSKLGYQPVCTVPGPTCANAIIGGTPVAVKINPNDANPTPIPWHYSVGHWIEDASTAYLKNSKGQVVYDDGAYSSPGLFGFYPWIDSSKTYYGVLAREDWLTGAYIDSTLCGKLIRKAWFSGAAQ